MSEKMSEFCNERTDALYAEREMLQAGFLSCAAKTIASAKQALDGTDFNKALDCINRLGSLSKALQERLTEIRKDLEFYGNQSEGGGD